MAEFQMPTIDKARKWIGDMFQEARSSFSRQRAQSVFESSSSFLPTSLQSGHRSAPGAVTYDVDSPFVNKLKNYCLRAFGGQEYNEELESHATTDTKAVYESNSVEIFERDVIQTNAPSVRCSVSTTSLEAVVHSRVGKLTTKKTETVETETIRLISTENENTAKLLNHKQHYCTETDVNKDFAGLSGEKHTRTFELSTSSYRDDKKAEAKIKEAFPNTYSVFRKKLSNIGNSSNRRRMEKVQSMNCCLITNQTEKEHTRSIRPMGKYTLKEIGKIKLDVQHFKRSRQLRIIFLSVHSCLEHNKKMFCKVTLIGKSSSIKKKTRTFRSNAGNADINEAFYMDLKRNELSGYALKVQLRTVSGLLQRQCKVGVAYISLENIDLMLDKTMTVTLRDSVSPRQVSIEDDLEIISENKSIHAEVFALLQESNRQDPRNLGKSRHQSLHNIHRNCVSVDRRGNSVTPEREVRTTINHEES